MKNKEVANKILNSVVGYDTEKEWEREEKIEFDNKIRMWQYEAIIKEEAKK